MKVIKRNGSKVDFDPSKIELAILKAMRYGSGVVDEKCAKDISFEIHEEHQGDEDISITGSKIRYLKSSFKKTRF